MNRYLLFAPATALLAGVLLVNGVREQYQVQPAAPMNAIPATYAGLPGTDVIVPEEERKVAGMSDYSMRFYGDSANPAFSVYVGYYDRQVQGKTIHSPRNCLPGAGWEIMNSAKVPVPGGGPGTVNRVLLGNRGSRALVYYWYQGRGRIESSEYRVKWDLLRDAAMHGRTEEALVRIVVPVGRPAAGKVATPTDEHVRAADETAVRVAAQLAPDVAKVLPAFPGT